ncbi:MAG: caspase family protein [Rhodocyclaceae bacterium]|jgi:WD40 repeat protein|nr:caspase family protein [Rhodocyclaceae bacterium]
MHTARWFVVLLSSWLLGGCAGMMQATPELSSGSPDRKVTVKSTVMAVGTLDYAPDGKQLISGGVTPVVRVWDMAAGKGLRTHQMEAPWGIVDVAYSRDGKTYAASSLMGLFGDSRTQLWDAASGELLKTVPSDRFGYKLAFSGDGRYLLGNRFETGGLLSNPYYNVEQLDIQANQIVRSYSHAMLGAVSPDGQKALLLGEFGRGLTLVDLASGRELWHSGGHHGDAAAFTPDGRQLLVARSEFQGTFGTSATISVVLLDASSGMQQRELLRQNVEGTFLATDKEFSKLSALAVAPDGRRFMTGTHKGEYKLWNLASGQMIRQLQRPNEKVVFDMSPAKIAFSPNGKLVAITSAASVRLYHLDSGEEAAAMIAFDDGEWLVTTPSGYYNASEKGDEYLSVTVGGQPYSISQLRESFFRPDLVKVALVGGTLGDYRKVADIKPPPAVAIVDTTDSTEARTVAVSLQIEDKGGGIGDVRLYRNGTAVILENARSMPAPAESRGSRTLRFEVPLEPGQNLIRAIAFNADNSMQSKDAQIEVQANIASRQPALHAIVIGIKDFANPRLALKYSVADAELFASTLENKARGLYSSVHVTRLLKPAETTNTAIVEALKRARSDVGPEDLFVFYVASHGTVDDGQYLLITSNVGSTSTARLKQDALTQDSIKELISNIPASKKLVVLDTCSAGQLGDAIQVAMLTRGMSDDTAMKVLSRAVGSTVLSAATSVQEALEGYKDHGLFTYVIAAGLNGEADANKDGFVKTLELADYVDSQVPELAEAVFKHKQYPIVSPTGQGFPLVRLH